MIRNIFKRRKDEDRKAEEPAAAETPEPPAAADPAPPVAKVPETEPPEAETPEIQAPTAEPPAPVEPPPPEKKGWFSRLKAGLSRSAGQLGGNITAVFKKRRLDDEALEELEELLIQADLGVAVAGRVRVRPGQLLGPRGPGGFGPGCFRRRKSRPRWSSADHHDRALHGGPGGLGRRARGGLTPRGESGTCR